jgi:hypothetical protein
MTTSFELAEDLVSRFDLTQLRHELRVADINAYPGSDDFAFWRWYRLAVLEAIDLAILATPKPIRRPGRIDIETVRSRADIIALAEGYYLRLRKSGRNFKTCCPFHHDRTPSFFLYPTQNRYHCFGCQADGDAIDFMQRMDGCDFRTACQKVVGV